MNKPFESNVSSPFGAPMGRRTLPLFGKVHLARVPLDNGGYDPGGAYWGIGAPLYCAWNDEGEMYFRAYSRDGAKTKIPGCTFYR